MFGHFDDQFDFGLADGLFICDELIQEVIELFLVLDFREDGELAAEAVTASILRNSLFAGLGFRTGGFSSVAPVGGALCGCRHAGLPSQGMWREGCAGWGRFRRKWMWERRVGQIGLVLREVALQRSG